MGAFGRRASGDSRARGSLGLHEALDELTRVLRTANSLQAPRTLPKSLLSKRARKPAAKLSKQLAAAKMVTSAISLVGSISTKSIALTFRFAPQIRADT